MCALAPFPQNFVWPLEEPISHHQQNYIYGGTTTLANEAFTSFLPQQVHQLDRSTSFTANSTDPNMVQKLYHNASERHRLKKINTLYSSLRTLLPSSFQTKKLSIPNTISHVLEYIPELQQKVERLVSKKEELVSRLSKQGDLTIDDHQENQRKTPIGSSLSSISASRLSDREIVVQISTNKVHDKNPLSEILLNLEEDGLVLINASSFESLGGTVFYNLHLQVERNYKLESEVLSEKLLSLYDKRENLCS